VDLSLPRRGSAEVTQGVVEVIALLTGIGLVGFVLVEAVVGGKLDGTASAVIAAIGLGIAGYAARALRDTVAFLGSRVLAGPDGVRLDSSGAATYAWSQIAAFEVSGPLDFAGATAAGAVMVLRDGQRVVLTRLQHLGGGGRAVDEITARVATLNRMLATYTARGT
jgi:hypothetical protein